MLNKNQSRKRNLVKYVLILPVLIGFIFLFQIKVIAQEKESQIFERSLQSDDHVRIVIDKNSTDAEIKNYKESLKKEHGITLKYSKIKRNSAGEITGIKLEFKDKDGNKGVSHVDGNEPIKPINFYKDGSKVGFGRPKRERIYTATAMRINDDASSESTDDSLNIAGNFNFDMDFEVPEAPEAPESPEAPEAPETPEGFGWNDKRTNVVISKSGDKEPTIIINGKVIKDEKEIEDALAKYGGKGKGFSYSSSSDGDQRQVFINGKNMMKIKSDAMADAQIQIKKMRPMMEKQREMMIAERSKVKAEMERVRAEMKDRKPEMQSAKAEMEAAKVEMQKAKAEMEAAKAEYEKAKAELKNPKK